MRARRFDPAARLLQAEHGAHEEFSGSLSPAIPSASSRPSPIRGRQEDLDHSGEVPRLFLELGQGDEILISGWNTCSANILPIVACAASLKRSVAASAPASEITIHARSELCIPSSRAGKCIFAGPCSSFVERTPLRVTCI